MGRKKLIGRRKLLGGEKLIGRRKLLGGEKLIGRRKLLGGEKLIGRKKLMGIDLPDSHNKLVVEVDFLFKPSENERARRLLGDFIAPSRPSGQSKNANKPTNKWREKNRACMR